MEILQYILAMGGYFVILLVITAFMRKNYKAANIIWIASLLTFPLWLNNVEGWFRWAKTLSVLLPTIIVGLSRVATIENKSGKFWELFQRQWVMWFLYGILFLNIMEATMKDFEMGYNLNALCGVILCLTIPYPGKFWNVGKNMNKGGYGDLVVYTTIGWNLLYTTWNACFVYGETGAYFASSLCIIFAAELYPIIKRRPELYVMTRVYTLATHILIRACWGGVFPQIMDASTWHNEQILQNWGVINGLICVPYALWFIWQLHTGKANTTFKKGELRNSNNKMKVA
jgi:hypothetical protein